MALGRVRTIADDEGADSPDYRRRLAEAEIATWAIDVSERRVLSALASGKNPGPASSMLKINGTEQMQRIDELAIEAAGAYAHVDQPQAREPGSNVAAVGPGHSLTAMPRYLNNRAASIYGGSNEIQRDIIARLVLGL
ncbi:acyl-CoA dehydrogenase family protein [Phenylobacterium sp. J367]|uniref:acyl-CoA dehydrogenase family protein n=1 Tax=Phenylobacterium sp. J367 TaxID=2898435 RepID=UPI0027E311C7|nr:acyl-CoA dehydrogenase family protein [Phenylobacterium sp. J367]